MGKNTEVAAQDAARACEMGEKPALEWWQTSLKRTFDCPENRRCCGIFGIRISPNRATRGWSSKRLFDDRWVL
jgi:hypothetical protein